MSEGLFGFPSGFGSVGFSGASVTKRSGVGFPQTIATGPSGAVITFPLVDWDTDEYQRPQSQSRLYVPRAGLYRVSGWFSFVAIASAGRAGMFINRCNLKDPTGYDRVVSHEHGTTTTSHEPAYCSSMETRMEEGEWIEMTAFHTSGSNKDSADPAVNGQHVPKMQISYIASV